MRSSPKQPFNISFNFCTPTCLSKLNSTVQHFQASMFELIVNFSFPGSLTRAYTDHKYEPESCNTYPLEPIRKPKKNTDFVLFVFFDFVFVAWLIVWIGSLMAINRVINAITEQRMQIISQRYNRLTENAMNYPKCIIKNRFETMNQLIKAINWLANVENTNKSKTC